MADIEPDLFALLVDEIVKAFVDPEALETWVTQRVPEDNPYNILVGVAFGAKATRLLQWANANGVGMDLLQRLSDHPPEGKRGLPDAIYYLTKGRIRTAVSNIPPVPPHKDWFVTQRPFANRVDLRSHLEALPTAAPGADSILIIEGEGKSGKSHGLRLARQCAPNGEFRTVDLRDWGSSQVYAWELAGAIVPKGSTELKGHNFDPSKEDAQVTWLFQWLTGKLHPGPQVWILLDHCNRPTLTQASAALIFRLAAAVERGDLPEVRLIMADVEAAKLPPELIKLKIRRDKAGLPDRKAVLEWCTTLAAHLHKAGRLKKECTKGEIDTWADSVFTGPALPGTAEEQAGGLETRLADVFQQIRSH
jgi:hypothetical protein